MFSKEELELIFDVFADLEVGEDKKELKLLKDKVALLKEQFILSDECNKKITEIQDKISKLGKEEK